MVVRLLLLMCVCSGCCHASFNVYVLSLLFAGVVVCCFVVVYVACLFFWLFDMLVFVC